MSAPLADVVACPDCDLLVSAAERPAGARLSCPRCGATLLTDRRAALDAPVAVSLAVLALLAAALFAPFLALEVGGLTRRISLFDAALAFAGGRTAPLVVATAGFVIAAPAARAALLVYVLGPLRLGRGPAPGARAAYAAANALRPWSMAEIFLIGVAVALVKVAGLASVTLGPAFFACGCAAALIAFEDATACRWSVWRMLGRAA